MSRFRINYAVEKWVDADTYEEAIKKTMPSDGFIQVVDVKEIT